MEVSFKFNNGESGAEMVSAILALFGAQQTVTAAAVPAAPIAGATINPIDNPAAGGDDSGPASNATHDAEGFPWDARIHSDKRTLTEKGIWRKRKGAPPHQISSVQAELRAAGKVIAPSNAPAPAPVAPTLPIGGAAMPPQASVTMQQPLPLPGAPAGVPQMPTMPTMPPQETPYQKFVNFVAANMHSAQNPAGKLTEDWVSQALAAMGIVGSDGKGYIQLLEQQPAERIQQVHAAFGQALGVAV